MSAVPYRIDGVDISHFQGDTINWAAAKAAGVKFVIHKATEGSTYRDPLYARRRAEIAKAGIPFGAYHFARPEGKDAVTEARAFIAYADPKPGDVLPALDLEVPGSWEQWSKDFMAEVQRLIGYDGPLIHYGPNDFGSDYPHIRWVPRYNNSNTPPTIPWSIWQASNGVYGVPNQVPGIGHCDINTFAPGFTVDRMLIPSPKPDPTPDPKPIVTTPFRVITANIRSFPLMSAADVRADVAAVIAEARRTPGTVICWQEMDGADYYLDALRDIKGYTTWFGPVGFEAEHVGLSTPITYDSDYWADPDRGRLHLIADSTAKVCYQRFLADLPLKRKADNRFVQFDNIHPPNPRIGKLAAQMWGEANTKIRGVLAEQMSTGAPIILSGDFNRPWTGRPQESLIGFKFRGSDVTYRVGLGEIDQTLTIDGRYLRVDHKSSWRIGGLHTDHKARASAMAVLTH